MKKRWKVLLGLGCVFGAGLGYAAWYGFRTGGPLPTREDLHKRWEAVSKEYMPLPKAGEPDAWKVFAEASEQRRAVDRVLWSPDVPNQRPVPEFGALGEPPPVARSADEGDQQEFKMQLEEAALAERCLAEYKAKGVIAKIDSLVGMVAGTSLDEPPAHSAALLLSLKPHLSQTRAFARINGARMRLAIQADDVEEFTHALRSNMTLARMSATGTAIIDRLSAISVEALTYYAVLTAVQTRPTERWLAAVEAELDRGVAGVPFAHAVRGELIYGIDGLLYAKEQGSFGPQRVAIDTIAAISGAPPVGSPGENIAELESYYSAFEALSAVPRPEREVKASDAAQLFAKPPRYRLVQILIPAVAKSIDSDDQVAMKRSAIRLSIAIERYRQRSGKLPDSLDALDPAVVKNVVDLWSGQPIRYRLATPEDKVPCGYMLYSVGYDKTDNAGRHKSGGDMFDALKPKGAGYDFVLNGPD